jgi:hypothetical protein
MKLFKITYETEVVILAKDENEAISSSEHYVIDATHKLMDIELVESMGQISNWKGCIPYSAFPGYNDFEKRCEEFLV